MKLQVRISKFFPSVRQEQRRHGHTRYVCTTPLARVALISRTSARHSNGDDGASKSFHGDVLGRCERVEHLQHETRKPRTHAQRTNERGLTLPYPGLNPIQSGRLHGCTIAASSPLRDYFRSFETRRSQGDNDA